MLDMDFSYIDTRDLDEKVINGEIFMEREHLFHPVM